MSGFILLFFVSHLVCLPLHLQGHHMSAALDERSTREVLDRNDAIDALKKEVEILEAEKTWLSAEVSNLNATRADLGNLRTKVESLTKQLEGSKATEALAAERALKANETAANLRKEVDAERESSTALQEQVNLLTKRLEDAKGIGLAVAKMYADTLEKFGGSTSLLPEEPLAFNLFSWMKAHFEKLPAFVGGAVDFGALASATSFAKMLAMEGCPHTTSIQERALEGPSSLGGDFTGPAEVCSKFYEVILVGVWAG